MTALIRRNRSLEVLTFIFIGIFINNCGSGSDFSQKADSQDGKNQPKAKDLRNSKHADVADEEADDPQIIGTENNDDADDETHQANQSDQSATKIKPKPAMPTAGAATPNLLAADPGVSALDTDFNVWCQKASEVQIISLASGLRALLAEFCHGGEAKALFKSTLIASAHQGGQQVNLSILRPLASDRSTSTTSIRVAYAIKMPTDVKDYFDRVSATAFDEAKIKEAVEGPGGKATVQILQRFDNIGPYHVRGVLNHQILQKSVQGRTVYVESDTRSDQFMFEDGLSYMYTGTVVRAIRSMKNTDTLAALVRVSGTSYMVVLVDVTVPNRGYPGIAEPELKRSTQAGTNALYQRILRYSAR